MKKKQALGEQISLQNVQDPTKKMGMGLWDVMKLL